MPWPFVLILLLLAAFFVVMILVHVGFRAPRVVEKTDPGEFGLEFRESSIVRSDGKKLFAWFISSIAEAPTVVIVHGWGGNAGLMLALAAPLHRAGMNVLLFDARNHGRSDSTWISSLPTFAEDTETAIAWLHENHLERCRQIALVGHSVGGAAVLLAAARRNDIAAVISLSAFAHPEWMTRRFLANTWIPKFAVGWTLRYVQWIIGHRYDDIAPLSTVCRLECPVLIVHGEADQTVPIADAHAIIAACEKPNLQLLTIAGVGHNRLASSEIPASELVDFLREVF